MGNTFPESLNKIDYSDTQKALNQIDEYIRYMCERIDFSITNISRTAANLGGNALEEFEVLDALQSSVAILSSSVGTLSGRVTSLTTGLKNVQDAVDTINKGLVSIDERLATLEPVVAGNVLEIHSLDERLKALENNSKGVS